MKCHKLKYSLKIILVILIFGSKVSAQTAPTLTPNTDQIKLRDNRGDHITFTASGGTCPMPPDPNGTCNWQPSGGKYYTWLYNTYNSGDPVDTRSLHGSPAPAGRGATLNLDIDNGGKTPVAVQANQDWIGEGGTHATTTSPNSTTVNAIVQQPKTITFDSHASVNGGASFKFLVKDQYGNPVKSAAIDLDETVPDFNLNVKNLGTGVTTTPPIDGKTEVPAYTGGTDSDGYIVDKPVGVPESTVNSHSVDEHASLRVTSSIKHTYVHFLMPDGSKIDLDFEQDQSVEQTSSYNPDTKTSTTTTTNITP